MLQTIPLFRFHFFVFSSVFFSSVLLQSVDESAHRSVKRLYRNIATSYTIKESEIAFNISSFREIEREREREREEGVGDASGRIERERERERPLFC